MDRRDWRSERMWNCSSSKKIILGYNDRWPENNIVWSKGLVKLLPKLGTFFWVIPAYANEIGAEVLPDRSIEPNDFPLPPPDLTTIARQYRQASIVIVFYRLHCC